MNNLHFFTRQITVYRSNSYADFGHLEKKLAKIALNRCIRYLSAGFLKINVTQRGLYHEKRLLPGSTEDIRV